jgi:hypothetical protein
MIYILLPCLVCILGLIVWAVGSKSEKPNEYVTEGGRIAYSYGLLVTLLACMTHAFTSLSPAISTSLSFFVCIVGFMVWLFAAHTVLRAAGKIAFKWGLFVSLLAVMTHVAKF